MAGRVMMAQRRQAKGTAVVATEETGIAVDLMVGGRQTLIRFCNIIRHIKTLTCSGCLVASLFARFACHAQKLLEFGVAHSNMAPVAGQLRWDLCDAQAAVAALVERHGLQHDDVVAHLVARGILPRHEDVDEDEDGWEDEPEEEEEEEEED